jgi:hypothetical protein
LPKLRATPQELREKALMKAIARSSIDLGLKSDTAIADYLRIGRSTYATRKKSNFQKASFEEVADMCSRLKFTASEVCAIFGVVPEGGFA